MFRRILVSGRKTSRREHKGLVTSTGSLQKRMHNSVLQETSMPKTLFAFGINHKTAPVAVREKLHLRESEIEMLLANFRQFLSECFILSTCNRTEIYAVSDSINVDIDFFKKLLIDFKNA